MRVRINMVHRRVLPALQKNLLGPNLDHGKEVWVHKHPSPPQTQSLPNC